MAFDWLKRVLKIQTRTHALDSSTQANTHALTHARTQTYETSSIDLDKESVQLGLAAGFTGRSIHDIDTSLNRIETLMTSKDWMTVQLDEHFRQHEENEQRRLETIINALNSLHSISLEAPEPLKTRLLDKITAAETHLGLSNRMKELIQLVKYYGEVNYFDLAHKMNITESGLRSLLTMTLRRTNEIEKFERDNRKWLKFKQSSDALSTQARALEPDTTKSSTNQTE
ncbi:MAG: hypothetical protein LUQ65_07540 [Candidatus Helarchaeota archaeon]|nr:hypothetical protein [Candidatus Helarchaeota archaeon]